MKTFGRMVPLLTAALAPALASALGGCSTSPDAGAPEPDRLSPTASTSSSSAVDPRANSTRMQRDASALLRGIEDALVRTGEAREDGWVSIGLPLSPAPVPAAILEELGVRLAAGNAAHISAYVDPEDYTVCIDRDGSGPSVSLRQAGAMVTTREAPAVCA